MGKWDWRLFVLAGIGLLCSGAPAVAQTPASGQVTFTKNIAPLLQRSCQRCHRPDSVAPMSLITYEQARPYARAMKQRTALARTQSGRGAMPPWFIDKTIGIQQFKDDISLSDAEIATFAAWADTGAPLGDPKDMPPALKFQGPAEWTLGKPDLIVSSPMMYVPAIGSDWTGPLGLVATGLKENRYIKSAEYQEWTDYDVSKLPKGATVGGRFVIHHGGVGITDESGIDASGVTAPEGGGGQLPIHEVGRNGDTFPDEAAQLIRARAALNFSSIHTHSAGVPGTERHARLNLGFVFQPVGYKPKYESTLADFGTTEMDINANEDNQRLDSYWIAPQHAKLLNYEPHMHAGGVRMCMEAIYGLVIETLNCAGYDHNWLKTYYYAENSQPLLPKNTILHAISWIDNTAKNGNLIETRNAMTFGQTSASNMIILFNRVVYLTDEQYEEELLKREEYLRLTGGNTTTCPECNIRAVPQAPRPSTATGGGAQ